MPYCAKCGVEVDYNVKHCPLCNFPIPNIKPHKKVDSEKFPTPKNVYPDKIKKLKKKVFFIITIILLSSIIQMIFLDLSIAKKFTWSKYSITCVIATWFYLFFIFGFIRKYKYLLGGLTFTTIVLLFLIDIFNSKLEWFLPIALPCTLLSTLVAAFIMFVFIKTPKKGFHTAACISGSVTFFCVTVECVISLFLKNAISLFWSIIVCIQLIPLTLLFLYLHYGLPEKYKIKLRQKFHL